MADQMQDKNKSDHERIMERKRRRDEGRVKKKKLIAESGGVRPRKKSNSNVYNRIESNNKDNKNNAASRPKPNIEAGSKSKMLFDDSKRNHRFGRVMDAIPCRGRSRTSTLSIAVPGSIVANCQTKELRTQLVGQIARAATIYHVDEIVVFDDKLSRQEPSSSFAGRSGWRHRDSRRGADHHKSTNNKDDNDAHKSNVNDKRESSENNDNRPKFDPHAFFARLLQYCETPQYLRRHFFPMHPDLQFAGLLAPIDAPHHVRAYDAYKYREGVVLDKMGRNGGSLVNCGIPNSPVEIATRLQPGIRCTVRLDPLSYNNKNNNKQGKAAKQQQQQYDSLRGEVVSPSAPRQDDGTYWGYTTRAADSLKAALDECPYGKYDLKIGTSERGSTDIDDATEKFRLPAYEHAIIVFGGVAGIEECVDADESLRLPGSQSQKLFDQWINVCKYQGSRTIRTEEAVLITLAKLGPKLQQAADAASAAASKTRGQEQNSCNSSNYDHQDANQKETFPAKDEKDFEPIALDLDNEPSVSEESSEDE